MLKEWLDANLSAIVEAEVAKEIDRIRRMAR
jgi:cell pole-organizing protein PopZ